MGIVITSLIIDFVYNFDQQQKRICFKPYLHHHRRLLPRPRLTSNSNAIFRPKVYHQESPCCNKTNLKNLLNRAHMLIPKT